MNSLKASLILCIDDDPRICMLEKCFLISSGYEVVTTDRGDKALSLAAKIKPNLILLDTMMPEIDGYEVCSKLQENNNTAYIPVIFVTALGGELDKARAFSVGAADYLVKPIRKDSFLKKIQAYLKTNTQWKQLQKTDVYETVLLEEEKIEGTKSEEKNHKKSILLVDDTNAILKLMDFVLKKRGYEVTTAHDGFDALLCLGKKTFDLIISDIRMPNLDGFRLLEILRQKGIETPVIFLTGSGDHANATRGFDLGAADYLQKPVDKEALLLSVKKVLGEKT